MRWRSGGIGRSPRRCTPRTTSEVERAVARHSSGLLCSRRRPHMRRLPANVAVKRRTDDGTSGRPVCSRAGRWPAQGRAAHERHARVQARACQVHGLGPGRHSVDARHSLLTACWNRLHTVRRGCRLKTVAMAAGDPDAALDLIERAGLSFWSTAHVLRAPARPGFSASKVASFPRVERRCVCPRLSSPRQRTLGCVVNRTYGSTEAPSSATAIPGARRRRRASRAVRAAARTTLAC